MKILFQPKGIILLQGDQQAPTPKSLSPAPGNDSGSGNPGAMGQSSAAQGPGAATAGSQKDGSPKKKAPGLDPCLSNLPLLLGAGILFYFLLIRPQQKQEKQRKAILASVKKGDKIVTTGGIHGEVVSLDDRTVTIKFGNDSNQRMTLDRAAIGRVPAREAELPQKRGG